MAYTLCGHTSKNAEQHGRKLILDSFENDYYGARDSVLLDYFLFI